jgi:hypothetical protein
MKVLTRGLAVAAVLSGAAVGLASPASAEPPSGSYTATMIDAGQSGKQVGSTTIWTMSTCGPDCTHVQTTSAGGHDFHLQDNTWIQADSSGDCKATIDNTSLVWTLACPDQPNVIVGLTKNG